jgi:hypothetical protein
MSENIANPDPAKVLARHYECMRRLMEGGLSFDDLQIPITDTVKRERLIRFWKSGCPLEPSALVSAKESKILEFVGIVDVPGVRTFAAARSFSIGLQSGVKIGSMTQDFRTDFLPKVEDRIRHRWVKSYRSMKGCTDRAITAEFKGEYEIALIHFWRLLGEQSCGQKNGALSTYDATANLAYIRNGVGTLRVAIAQWCNAGWFLDSQQFYDSRERPAGLRVLCGGMDVSGQGS